MGACSFKVSFNLDEDDVTYFRMLFRRARANAATTGEDEIISSAAELVALMRTKKNTPRFILEAVGF